MVLIGNRIPGAPADAVPSNPVTRPDVSTPFVLQSETVTFAPRFFPETLRVRKQRELNREQNFCGGEDVTDQGSKNRDIHAAGLMTGPALDKFNSLVDSDEKFVLTSASWSGEVRVDEGEYEGPTMYHVQSGDYMWEYTLDLVSTGVDESDNHTAVTFGPGGLVSSI